MHCYVILALYAFCDFYEPRGLKSLFNTALFISYHAPDQSGIEAIARCNKFIGHTLFYRDLLAEIGISRTERSFAERKLNSAGQRLVG